MYILFTILAIVLLFLDFKKTSQVKLIFACTFLFCAIIAYKFPNNLNYQLISMPVFFFVFKFLIGSIMYKEIKDIKKKKDLMTDFIGKKAVVIKDIGKSLSIDGFGSIKLNNQIWDAKSVDDSLIKAGSRVKIVSLENKVMNVEALKSCKK